MWTFIFVALAASSYVTLSTATRSGVIEAYAKERKTISNEYYVVFDKIVREQVQRRWVTFTKMTMQSEVCSVTKEFADDLRSDKKTIALGKSHSGATFLKIKKRYAAEVRADIAEGKCVTVKRPWWHWFVFNGGGHVS